MTQSIFTLDSLVGQLQKNLETLPQIQLAFLFGSAASGRLQSHSDIDLAIAEESSLSFDLKLELVDALSHGIPYEIDLIDLQKVHGPILQQALCTGILLRQTSVPLFADLIKKMWYNQADMMPLSQMILQKHCDQFSNG